MNKMIMLFCEQNPSLELECSKCKNKEAFNSASVFRNNSFSYTCKKCGANMTVDTSEFINSFEKELSRQGIFI